MATILLAVLYFLSFQGLSMAGICHRLLGGQQGEMIVLTCKCLGKTPGNFTWTHHRPSGRQPTLLGQGDLSGGSLLVQGRRLVVLEASAETQGNYSCTHGNSSSSCWFTLTVNPAGQDLDPSPQSCHQKRSCTLKCPEPLNIPTLTLMGTVWHKDNDTLPDSFKSYFRNVMEEDGGVYTCIHSYQYRGRLYNLTRSIELKVKSNRQDNSPTIQSPKPGEVFPVHIGSQLVVPCEVVVYNTFDNVYWSHVEANQNLSVYFNSTEVRTDTERKITVSLIFQKVTEDQLSTNYTCNLASTKRSSRVTISLALKALPVSVYMVAGLAVLLALLLVVISTLVYLRCRVQIILLLRDKLNCHGYGSDGKQYDAYVMTYKSSSSTAFTGEDRRWMENVLEDQLGYRLCLQDRDESPGAAVAEAVMRCIQQSRRVLLLPSSEDRPNLWFGLPSAIHAALVEKKSRLLLVRTKVGKGEEQEEEEEEVLAGRPEGEGSSSLVESLSLLTQAGSSVTWGGPCSRPLSSSFWKNLRYHLPAPRQMRAMQSTLESVC